MRTTFLLILCAVLFITTRAQDTAACTRQAYKLHIPGNKNLNYEQDLAAGPYLLADTSLLIYTGETVNLEVEQKDGVVKSLKPVCIVRHPDITLVISVTHVMEKKRHKTMMLKIFNPFPMELEYKAFFQQLEGTHFESTGVLPVMAKGTGYETWSNFIISLDLRNFSFRIR